MATGERTCAGKQAPILREVGHSCHYLPECKPSPVEVPACPLKPTAIEAQRETPDTHVYTARCIFLILTMYSTSDDIYIRCKGYTA